MENRSWVVVQKIYYWVIIIKLILSPHCLAAGHRSQDETTHAHFVVKKPSYSIEKVQPEFGYVACSSYFWNPNSSLELKTLEKAAQLKRCRYAINTLKSM